MGAVLPIVKRTWNAFIRPVVGISGIPYIISKFRYRKPSEETPPTGLLWVLGIHIAVFGLASGMHQQSVNEWGDWVAGFSERSPNFIVGFSATSPNLNRSVLFPPVPPDELGPSEVGRERLFWCQARNLTRQSPAVFFKPDIWDYKLVGKFLRSDHSTYYDMNRPEFMVLGAKVGSAYKYLYEFSDYSELSNSCSVNYLYNRLTLFDRKKIVTAKKDVCCLQSLTTSMCGGLINYEREGLFSIPEHADIETANCYLN